MAEVLAVQLGTVGGPCLHCCGQVLCELRLCLKCVTLKSNKSSCSCCDIGTLKASCIRAGLFLSFTRQAAALQPRRSCTGHHLLQRRLSHILPNTASCCTHYNTAVTSTGARGGESATEWRVRSATAREAAQAAAPAVSLASTGRLSRCRGDFATCVAQTHPALALLHSKPS